MVKTVKTPVFQKELVIPLKVMKRTEARHKKVYELIVIQSTKTGKSAPGTNQFCLLHSTEYT